jgi:cell division transport system permease protein
MIALPVVTIGGNLPFGRDAAAWYVPVLVAFLVFVAALCGIGLVAARDAAAALIQATAGTLTVQVPAEASDARLQTVLGTLRQTKGITAVRLLDRKEIAQLLEPWLGPSAPIDDLPVPRIIDIQTASNGGFDIAVLQQQLASILPEGRLQDQAADVADARGGSQRVEIVLAAGLVAAFGLVLLLTMYAVGGSIVIEQQTIELIHLLGARDSDIAWQFTLRAALIAFAGGLGGAVLALLTDLFLRGAGAFLQFAGGNALLGPGDWRLWAVLVGATVLAGIVAMASARVTVLRRLATLP